MTVATAALDPAAFAFRAECRAVEEGHRARVADDGSVAVKSDSTDGVTYNVTFAATPDGRVRFGCTCPSGFYRNALPVPCKHAALAARRLERERLAEWSDGLWTVRQVPRDVRGTAPARRTAAVAA